VGRWGCKSEKIKEIVQQLELIQEVIFTDYIPDEHLPLIYNNALLFVFPSLAEGFSLPVLEAMACGLPIITSNAPALKEIAEEVAITVDPHNYYLLADKMKEVIISHKLRSQLSEKSLQQARNFSWENCARKTLKVYKEVFSQKPDSSRQ
ncbi:MAG: glycosyltransferase family 4 protein, partial [Candidatus Sumerlaeia bacterium]|nr:glycosyltransferase family 4 protein [Candidatus Sumerlaeia bacterium]